MPIPSGSVTQQRVIRRAFCAVREAIQQDAGIARDCLLRQLVGRRPTTRLRAGRARTSPKLVRPIGMTKEVKRNKKADMMITETIAGIIGQPRRPPVKRTRKGRPQPASRRRNSRALAKAAFISLLVSATAIGQHVQDAMSQMQSGASPFARQMAEAMRRMDRDMGIQPSGNVDRDFAAMMIPHHQGAIDMAKAELEFGRDPVLRRLAQGIIVEQQQEIELMRRELDRLPVASSGESSVPRGSGEE